MEVPIEIAIRREVKWEMLPISIIDTRSNSKTPLLPYCCFIILAKTSPISPWLDQCACLMWRHFWDATCSIIMIVRRGTQCRSCVRLDHNTHLKGMEDGSLLLGDYCLLVVVHVHTLVSCSFDMMHAAFGWWRVVAVSSLSCHHRPTSSCPASCRSFLMIRQWHSLTIGLQSHPQQYKLIKEGGLPPDERLRLVVS